MALAFLTKEVNEALDGLLKSSPEPHAPLGEAARYALLGGGKRLRPLLLLALAKDLDIPLEQALPVACSLELIHTYSLIHDDLPCMDNASHRRGKPALHHAFGEALALLTGDFFLTLAFETTAKTPHLVPEKRVELILLLAERSGGEGMIGGQTVDILSQGKSLDPPLKEWINRKKTGALFSAGLECGSILAELPEPARALLRSAGLSFGVFFQLQDDLEDQDGESSKEELIQKRSDAFRALSKLPFSTPFLQEAMHSV